jgi:crotonobetainyl-CoA hydratase
MSASQAQMLRLPQLIEALRSEDQNEGVAAFQEKRPPKWTGR